MGKYCCCNMSRGTAFLISLHVRIARIGWSQSSLSAWSRFWSLATHRALCEYSDLSLCTLYEMLWFGWEDLSCIFSHVHSSYVWGQVSNIYLLSQYINYIRDVLVSVIIYIDQFPPIFYRHKRDSWCIDQNIALSGDPRLLVPSCITPNTVIDYLLHYAFKFFRITKTCLYKFDPIKPHFYIVKLGFTGLYIIFSYFCTKTYLGEAVLTSVHNICFDQKYGKYQNFYLKTYSFWWWNFHYIWIGVFS